MWRARANVSPVVSFVLFWLRHDSGGSIRAGLNDNFLMQMAEFMGAFMEANLGRVLGMGKNTPLAFRVHVSCIR